MALKVTDTFKYLDKQQQEEVLRVSDNNSQFAIGLGESLGFIYRTNELSENLSKRINGFPKSKLPCVCVLASQLICRESGYKR
ncbi:MAG TPA: hypothetical protein VE504_07635 [Nitrososphaeraceae archaeon]|jgi:hypothetical protein|nr:hypothetical protein [Nitrososphaeraceae archaeon]